MAGWLLRLFFFSSFGFFLAMIRRPGVLLLLCEGGMGSNVARPGAYSDDGEGETDAPFPEGPLGRTAGGIFGNERWMDCRCGFRLVLPSTGAPRVTSIGWQAGELPLCMASAACACPDRTEQTPDAKRCDI